MQLEECLQRFEQEYTMRLEERTIVLYQTTVNELLAHCAKPFPDITTRDIRGWLLHLEELGIKPATVRKKLYGLRCFYRFCREERIVTRDPVQSIPLPKLEDQIPRYLVPDELLQLKELVGTNRRNQAMVEVFYTTGVRISELIEIRQEDIDWSERSILILKGKRKKERIVLFTRRCAEYLQAYLKERSDSLPHLFLNAAGTKPIGIRGIQHQFSAYAKELDIPFSPHLLRHTFAAHLAVKGMPFEGIQALLGHEDPRNTQIYARLYDHARKQQYDQWT